MMHNSHTRCQSRMQATEHFLITWRIMQGGVCLEELLQLDRAADGIVLSPAVHYMEGKLVGQGLVDQIMVGTSYRCAA